MKEEELKLITAIVPKGRALAVLERLRSELGILAGNVHNARGTGRITPGAYRGIGSETEREVLTVAAPAARAEEVFEFVYSAADIGSPHGGILYMTSLSRATRYELPDLPDN